MESFVFDNIGADRFVLHDIMRIRHAEDIEGNNRFSVIYDEAMRGFTDCRTSLYIAFPLSCRRISSVCFHYCYISNKNSPLVSQAHIIDSYRLIIYFEMGHYR